jgi:hypothetical protein
MQFTTTTLALAAFFATTALSAPASSILTRDNAKINQYPKADW